MNDFSQLIEALQELNRKNNKSDLPELQTMEELEKDYIEFTKHSKTLKYDFGSWLPTLGRRVRAMVPGEVCTVLAETGVGKTVILHNIAINAAPLKTAIFEIELPGTLSFERFIALQTQIPGSTIEASYERGQKVDWKRSALDHITTCSQSRLSIEDITRIIKNAPDTIGYKPALVMIDYIGLLFGKGNSRYERMSTVAEDVKKMAKELNVIVIMASQVSRKGADASSEIFLHDGKDSGSLENSSGIVLGAWREGEFGELMKLKVLKQTKGKASGFTLDCHFKGETGLITEIVDRSKGVPWND